jgi:hypothetical protein
MRAPEATGTFNDEVVNLDGSRDTGQKGSCAFSNVNTTESMDTNNLSNYSREHPSTASKTPKNKAIFSDPAARSTRAHDILDRTLIFSILIALIGVGVSAAFLGLGLRGAESDKTLLFERQASQRIKAVEIAWHDFEVAGLWIHEACRASADENDIHFTRGICSRKYFFELHEYLLSSGLDFQAAAWVPNVTHVDRASMEEDSRTCKY